MLRIKDEAPFVKDSILSCIDALDELIVYDNGSTDGTYEIIKDLTKVYKKIKLYSYTSKSKYFVKKLCNKCFKKTHYLWVLKIDGDQIYDIEQLFKLRKIALDNKNKHSIDECYSLSGINVSSDGSDFIFPKKLLDNNLVLVNGVGDHFLFKKRLFNMYITYDYMKNGKNIIETFVYPYIKSIKFGICWLHLGYIKHGLVPKNYMSKESKFSDLDISMLNDTISQNSPHFPEEQLELFDVNDKTFSFKDIDVIDRLKTYLSKDNHTKYTKKFGGWKRSNLQS